MLSIILDHLCYLKFLLRFIDWLFIFFIFEQVENQILITLIQTLQYYLTD